MFCNYDHDVVVSVSNKTNWVIILDEEIVLYLSDVVDIVMWSNSVNSNISIKEITITSNFKYFRTSAGYGFQILHNCHIIVKVKSKKYYMMSSFVWEVRQEKW